jgi:MAF protein
MLILASASPRRRSLLSILNNNFQVQTSEIDETILPGENPLDYVLRLATTKSLAIKPDSVERPVVIAADTAVVDGEQILGKPNSKEHAIQMLIQLRGRAHEVITGLAVCDVRQAANLTDLCSTQVLMRDYQLNEVEEYIESGDPMDKAGAYAIQNSNFYPVAQVSGCYANVVGLPLCHLASILNQLDIPYDAAPIRGCRTGRNYNCQLVDRIEDMHSQD